MGKNSYNRKLEAKKFNELSKVPTTLDSKKFTWRKNHKKCFGRGYMGYDVKTGELIKCSCLKVLEEPKATDSQDIPEVETSKVSN